ncbi:MAG: ErfK/YbiS/YcfS/YnhG family protein [Parcubacteria group bacterium GW2011_GWA1_47_10]|uniref:ErfK/YbiS/YcfS/YnhG family protein n=1 Tax=Candidatus Nomurabacteria bacterium GW2011_GWB1_47_6 TaxID=1618749 RepID=A0A0G1T228_9BACT|nr:MAG: ErfK/YbiS/YcfS/YnhG family protein [Parcubacteria group bacterium GW2011_GWA1_47_10]KKU75792.1 MAG: ErfK/YbiS/YcfS/YnhG family protein [Candidatus Nomurabacteria bacterium GW2011_GWB1_47_6]
MTLETPQQEKKGNNKISRRKFIKIGGASIVAGAVAGGVAKFLSRGSENNDVKIVGGREQIKEKEKIPLDIQNSLEKLKINFNLRPDEFAIVVSPERQELYLTKNDEILKTYIISTGKAGMGSEIGSGKTPIGAHRIKEKIGDGAEIGTVFKGRQNTRYLAGITNEKIDLPQDDITTRIMWLDGQEENINRGGNVDSHSRYTYIHGTPEEGLLGEPNSHGCIRMKNSDVVELFDVIPPETLVEIQSKPFAGE